MDNHSIDRYDHHQQVGGIFCSIDAAAEKKNAACEEHERNHMEKPCKCPVLTFWWDMPRVKGQTCRHREQVRSTKLRRQRRLQPARPSLKWKISSKCWKRRGRLWVNGLQRPYRGLKRQCAIYIYIIYFIPSGEPFLRLMTFISRQQFTCSFYGWVNLAGEN